MEDMIPVAASNPFSDVRCASCAAALACVTDAIVGDDYWECTQCGKVIVSISVEYSDASLDSDVEERDVTVPNWCPRANVRATGTCDDCEDELDY